jgi:hypothetical protein
MTQRHEWQFEFTAKKLAEAAAKKKAHHQSRLKWWEEAKAQVMTEVKDSGIEVSTSVADRYSNKSPNFGPQVMVRADLQQKLSECHQKIQEHYGKVQEFEGWIQVLNGNAEARLPLNSDDYLFFFSE